MLSIDVTGYTIVRRPPHVVYHISIIYQKNESRHQWQILKRFSEIEQIHALSRRLPNYPIFPSHILLNKFDKKQIERRQFELAEYFKILSLRNDVTRSPEMWSFLELERAGVVSEEYIPSLVSKVSNTQFGVCQAEFKDSYLVVGSSDTDVLSRLDSYLANYLQLPWESKRILITVSKVSLWKMSPSGELILSWSESFTDPVMAVALSKTNAYAGFASGHVTRLDIEPSTPPQGETRMLEEVPRHIAAVTDLVVCEDRSLLISSSTDHRLKFFTLSDLWIITEISLSSSISTFVLCCDKCLCGLDTGEITKINFFDNYPKIEYIYKQKNKKKIKNILCLHDSILSANENGLIIYWVQRTLTHEWNVGYGIGSIEWLPMQKIILIGCDNGCVVFASLSHGCVEAVIPSHSEKIVFIKSIPDTHQIITAAQDGLIKVWECPNAFRYPTIETVNSEIVKSETVKSETVKSETVKSETVKSETVKSETVKSETVKSDTNESDGNINISENVEKYIYIDPLMGVRF
eukprot:GHVL01035329.1.p1 GENE.GHVL01035329.1~~GHVL01035329.1.p1  ORF type:complete len:531 (+),score=119.18 GHVL01035329.1:33-1595(+)